MTAAFSGRARNVLVTFAGAGVMLGVAGLDNGSGNTGCSIAAPAVTR